MEYKHRIDRGRQSFDELGLTGQRNEVDRLQAYQKKKIKSNQGRILKKIRILSTKISEHKKQLKGMALLEWKRKRKAWFKHYSEHPTSEAPAGEIVNILEGLTPDGYDKQGRKVSFVEQGKPVIGFHK